LGFTSSTFNLLEVSPLGFFIILTDLETRLKKLYKKLGIPEWENLHSDICNEIQRITIKEKLLLF